MKDVVVLQFFFEKMIKEERIYFTPQGLQAIKEDFPGEEYNVWHITAIHYDGKVNICSKSHCIFETISTDWIRKV